MVTTAIPPTSPSLPSPQTANMTLPMQLRSEQFADYYHPRKIVFFKGMAPQVEKLYHAQLPDLDEDQIRDLMRDVVDDKPSRQASHMQPQFAQATSSLEYAYERRPALNEARHVATEPILITGTGAGKHK